MLPVAVLLIGYVLMGNIAWNIDGVLNARRESAQLARALARIEHVVSNPADAVAAAVQAASAQASPGPVSAEDLKAMIDGFVAEGLRPAAVAQMVVDAIERRRFYILTHPEWQSMVRDRVERMLSDENPAMALPGN